MADSDRENRIQENDDRMEWSKPDIRPVVTIKRTQSGGANSPLFENLVYTLTS